MSNLMLILDGQGCAAHSWGRYMQAGRYASFEAVCADCIEARVGLRVSGWIRFYLLTRGIDRQLKDGLLAAMEPLVQFAKSTSCLGREGAEPSSADSSASSLR